MTDGSQCEVEFYKEAPHGEFIKTFPNGDKRIGQLKNGKYCGTLHVYKANGEIWK